MKGQVNFDATPGGITQPDIKAHAIPVVLALPVPPALPVLPAPNSEGQRKPMTANAIQVNDLPHRDELTDHLRVLRAEFEKTVHEMEAMNATTAAAAYYNAQIVCERFLFTPDCFD